MSAPERLQVAAAARSRSAAARASASIDILRQQPQPVTFAAVARHAGVSRTFLYGEPQLRAAITGTRARAGGPSKPRPETAARDDGLVIRLQQAHHRITELRRENSQLRAELAAALAGQRSARQQRPTAPSATLLNVTNQDGP